MARSISARSVPAQGADRPTSKIGALRDLLVALLEEHERDGAIPTSARFLYYELVQRGQLSKQRNGARRPDQILHEALTDIREDGRVPWRWIVDETRAVEHYTGHGSVRDGVLTRLPFIKLNPWRRAPMILTESRSLAGVLRDIVRDYRCRIASTNGQCGGFLHTDVAPYLQPDDTVIYLGDLDLAGDDIENNTRRVLEREVGAALDWERLALTEQQAAEYNLPRITKTDRRFKNGGGIHEAIETEALRQTVLVNILRARLDELLPEPLARVHEREQRQRRRIAAVLARHRGRR
jgi:hypothetical protein